MLLTHLLGRVRVYCACQALDFIKKFEEPVAVDASWLDTEEPAINGSIIFPDL